MDEVTNRRRIAARLGLAAALIALPLTATITYAESADLQEAPPAPVPPEPPAPPAPPAPPLPASVQGVADVDEPQSVEEEIDELASPDGKHEVHKRRIVIHRDEKMTPEERAALRARLAEDMQEMRIELAEAREAHKAAMIRLKDEMGEITTIEVKCSQSDDPVSESVDPKGKKVIKICKTAIDAHARAGLAAARAEIAADREMSDDIRAEVLKALDEELARMSSDG